MEGLVNGAGDPVGNGTDAATNEGGEKSKKGKKLSVERIYQKKTQLEHIILRPDSYIGSIEHVTESMWVYDGEESGLVHRSVTFVPGLYKIFDEILVNAADNKQRDSKMDCIKVDINPEQNTISVWNNGKGIPVVTHKVEKMYVPSLIFGHLLTSSNYNDEEEKVTGGRNGFGAKLCNIFSTKFTVETATKESKKIFKQVWGDNMSKTSEPKIKDYSGEDFTKITFSPDLKKFKMECLDKDIVAMMSRRAYDVAGSTGGVKVFLNGKKLPIKNFKDYVDQYLKGKEDETGNPLKVVYEKASDRWEVGVTLSDRGFQQVSFVNSIATTKGGRHVDYITDQLVSKLIESVKKKNKGGVQIKPFQVKNHMWVFVNCLIVNPTFDSQTKENMTLTKGSFGSKCQLSDKFITASQKSGIVEAVTAWARFKADNQLKNKFTSKKANRIKGVPKLEDAHDAGTKNSVDCTLIVTEGDSAKTLAISGLGVVGRERYGVFPLRGKMLNVREATHKQILENAEINNIIKIIGLQYKKKYESIDDLKALRYGKLMIMADQDQDGSHIKGLLINFIHHNWPTLLKLPFLEEFITPIVKATKGKESYSFFSIPEFMEWRNDKPDWNKYKIKYYKGLGTSTSNEAKEYFSNMMRHRIKFKHESTDDDSSIVMAFSKKCIDQRKEWLTSGMEERKTRKEMGLSEVYLYGKDTRSVTYSDFINKELILFSNMDNERSIPSAVDGFKPGQRKVIFTCFKRNIVKEFKVAQLAGSVAEHSAYHHGETSLMGTIIVLAQNFVGSNNINLLLPIGQFGTRLQGGKDSASARYIFTQLSPLARAIFHPHDEPLLNFLQDDNQRIEPEWYIPVIPMVLVNGAEGIGTGWSTKIPNYNPREIIENLLRMINGEEPRLMKPWYKGYRGEIERLDSSRFLTSGELAILTSNKLEITELPIKVWTQGYKESVLEPMLQGSEKTPSSISDFKECHTDTTVRFVVSMPENKMDIFEREGMHKAFKLQTVLHTSSMVLFDHNGVLKKYENPQEILQEFFTLRMSYYEKRKAYLEGMLGAESGKLSNQARFILEKCENKLIIENKKKKAMIQELADKGYDSDPVKAWKLAQNRERALEEESENADSQEERESNDGPDYDYLLGMSMWNLTKEKKEELLKKRDEKLQELAVLEKKTPSDIWREDLANLKEELDKFEAKEKAEAEKDYSKQTKGGGRGAKKNAVINALPSPSGQRVAPVIDAEMKKRLEKADIVKEFGGRRKKKAEAGESLEAKKAAPKSLMDRIGVSKDEFSKKRRSGDGMKQTKLSFKKSSPKKGGNPWDSDSDEFNSDMSSDDIGPVAPRQDRGPRRAAATNATTYKFSESESSDDEMELKDNLGVKEASFRQTFDSDLDETPIKPKPKPKPKEQPKTVVLSDSEGDVIMDSDLEPSKKRESAENLFDSLIAETKKDDSPPAATGRGMLDSDSDTSVKSFGSFKGTSKPKQAKKPAAKKKKAASGSEDEKPKKKAPAKKKAPLWSDDDEQPKKKAKKKAGSDDEEPKKKGPKKKAVPKKKKADSDSDDMFPSKPTKKKKGKKTDDTSEDDDDFNIDDVVPSREKSGRARATKTYTFDLSDDDDDSDF